MIFCDKGMEQINLNRIKKSEFLLHACQDKLRLTRIIYTILNYKETVQSIIVDDEILFSSSAGAWYCERSTFRDKK